MSRPRSLLALVAALVALGLAAAGCGSGFSDQFKPVDQELHGIGVDLFKALRGANKQTNAQFAATVRGLEHRISDVEGKLAGLDPPDEIKGDYGALRADLRKVDNDMIQLASRVAVNDVSGTRTAAGALIRDSSEVTPKLQQIRKKLGLPAPK